jgi:hypothetical protein
MYWTLRGLHLSVALFSLIFLLAYGISAVDFAHRKWLPHASHTTEEKRKFAAGITDARILAREWRGELDSIENTPGFLKFFVIKPLGTSYEVTYSITTGDATVQSTTGSFFRRLAWLHTSHEAWAVVVGFVSLLLLTLGVTGLYLWFKNHSERWIGIALLLAGSVVTLGLIVSMRLD